ncbi:MAG: GNAT family N-acetyltransferase [Burkholderiales bacterium RIFCSPLOWO2_12_FULL_61_40]|nr:MAG: GNAT family N-acetyltransferase [Burkholderiales bacterium RIFCSPLOWO2_12_FULL_61_40]
MPNHHSPLCDRDIETLERATLDAVAPPAVEAIDGWLLPFDASTIGRAKSAVPLRHQHPPGADATAMLCTMEARYAAHGLPAAFRVADVPGMAAVHAALARRGYQAQQPTLVQTGATLHLRHACRGTPAQVSNTPHTAWSGVYLAEGFDPVDGAYRVQALSRSPHVVYASVVEAGLPVAAGTAAFSQGWASVHGMRTVQSGRGQGLAGRVLAGLADAALARGLDRVFLQVEEGNTAALALYQRVGFATAWRYHYWRRPQG